MILERVSIEGFRSIKAKQLLPVNELVSILIGANDHGKSNILDAILSLNEDRKFTSDDRNWDMVTEEKLPRVQWHFVLTDDEYKQLQDIKPPVVEELTATQAEGAETSSPDATSEPKKVQAVKASVELPKKVVIEREGVGSDLVIIDNDDVLTDEHFTKILSMKPQVELFSKEQKLPDSVTLEDLEKPEFETIKGLFIKAGLWENRATLFTPNNVNRRQLEEASTKLTKTLRDEWEQGNELEWKFGRGEAPTSITIEIKDPSVKIGFVPLSKRSTGFTSFFVLGLSITARSFDDVGKKHIYLFDEPGNNLHPIAQVNLQRVFESLAKQSQIIYTTHSIFLINNNVLARNNVVKKTTNGTLINRKPYLQDWKAVRDSLGLALCNNFLISDRTLLVEGPSDKVYVLTALRFLMRHRELDIDLNNFSIVDAGDSKNMLGMASIMVAEGRKVVVMVDGDKSGLRAKSDITKAKKEEVRKANIEFTTPGDNLSTEDILPHRAILLDSVMDAAQQLIDSGARKIASGKGIETLKSELSTAVTSKGDKTLGRIFDEESRKFFLESDEPDAVSKVSTAEAYENRISAVDANGLYTVEADTEENMDKLASFVADLKKKLNLHSQTADKSILEQTE